MRVTRRLQDRRTNRSPGTRLLAAGSGVALVFASAILVSGAPTAASATAAAPAAPTPVGAAPALPAGATQQGPVAASSALRLTVVLLPRDPAGLAALAKGVSTPGSPNYRHYLAPGEFGQRFGPTDATIAAVTSALTGMGLPSGTVSGNRLAISFTTTAGVAEAAFGVHLSNVRLANGRVAYANDVAPRIPSSIAPSVSGVLGLDNLVLDHPQLRHAPATAARATTALAKAPAAARARRTTSTAITGPQPCAAATTAAATFHAYTADQLAQAYSFSGLYAQNNLGQGVTIAVYELASYIPSDVDAFQACYGTTAPVTNIAVDGGPNPADGGAIEAELDIEGVISMAPKANIAVYLGPNGAGTFDTYNRIVSDDTAKVITTSWGNCELARTADQLNQRFILFEQAAIQGQSILAAAGDNGSEDCAANPGGTTALTVDDPAAQPFVTGVGGTNLTAVGPAPSETVYDNVALQLGAGGGGISNIWAMPPVQHGPGVLNAFSSGVPCNAPGGALCRQVPDVAASADPASGYMVFYTGTETGVTGWQSIGGTSAASPLWAALIALGDQRCACSLGFLNAALYNIAAGAPGAFNDITVGNNDYLSLHGGAYPATAGYDMATGLGTPIATALLARLAPQPTAPAITSAASTTFTVGVAGSFTVTATGTPAPTVAETGALPAGVTFNPSTMTLSGTPGQQTKGSYPVTFTATNGVGAPATQSFTLTVDQAVFTYPVDGQTGVDTTRMFTWSTIPEAQAYYFIVGTSTFGFDLVNSGVLSSATTSFPVPALPAGPALHATLLAEVNGAFTSFQAISFTAAPGLATFTYPLNGQADVDPTHPFTWATIPQAQGYIVVAGTTFNGTNVFNSGVLAPTASSFTPPLLPSNQILFATLLTKVNGAFTRSQTIVLIAKPPTATFTFPVDGQANVATPSNFTWTPIFGAQNYFLVVGTTPNGKDLVNSGLIAPTASSFSVPKLPSAQLLFATLLTEVNGTWTSQQVVFIAT